MQKRKPTHALARVKELVEENRCVFTKTCLSTAAELGFSEEGVKDVILSLDGSWFYKSESDRIFPGQWQDVYKPRQEGLQLYVKFKIIMVDGEALLVLSFKEK